MPDETRRVRFEVVGDTSKGEKALKDLAKNARDAEESVKKLRQAIRQGSLTSGIESGGHEVVGVTPTDVTQAARRLSTELIQKAIQDAERGLQSAGETAPAWHLESIIGQLQDVVEKRLIKAGGAAAQAAASPLFGGGTSRVDWMQRAAETAMIRAQRQGVAPLPHGTVVHPGARGAGRQPEPMPPPPSAPYSSPTLLVPTPTSQRAQPTRPREALDTPEKYYRNAVDVQGATHEQAVTSAKMIFGTAPKVQAPRPAGAPEPGVDPSYLLSRARSYSRAYGEFLSEDNADFINRPLLAKTRATMEAAREELLTAWKSATDAEKEAFKKHVSSKKNAEEFANVARTVEVLRQNIDPEELFGKEGGAGGRFQLKQPEKPEEQRALPPGVAATQQKLRDTVAGLKTATRSQVKAAIAVAEKQQEDLAALVADGLHEGFVEEEAEVASMLESLRGRLSGKMPPETTGKIVTGTRRAQGIDTMLARQVERGEERKQAGEEWALRQVAILNNPRLGEIDPRTGTINAPIQEAEEAFKTAEERYFREREKPIATGENRGRAGFSSAARIAATERVYNRSLKQFAEVLTGASPEERATLRGGYLDVGAVEKAEHSRLWVELPRKIQAANDLELESLIGVFDEASRQTRAMPRGSEERRRMAGLVSEARSRVEERLEGVTRNQLEGLVKSAERMRQTPVSPETGEFDREIVMSASRRLGLFQKALRLRTQREQDEAFRAETESIRRQAEGVRTQRGELPEGYAAAPAPTVGPVVGTESRVRGVVGEFTSVPAEVRTARDRLAVVAHELERNRQERSRLVSERSARVGQVAGPGQEDRMLAVLRGVGTANRRLGDEYVALLEERAALNARIVELSGVTVAPPQATQPRLGPVEEYKRTELRETAEEAHARLIRGTEGGHAPTFAGIPPPFQRVARSGVPVPAQLYDPRFAVPEPASSRIATRTRRLASSLEEAVQAAREDAAERDERDTAVREETGRREVGPVDMSGVQGRGLNLIAREVQLFARAGRSAERGTTEQQRYASELYRTAVQQLEERLARATTEEIQGAYQVAVAQLNAAGGEATVRGRRAAERVERFQRVLQRRAGTAPSIIPSVVEVQVARSALRPLESLSGAGGGASPPPSGGGGGRPPGPPGPPPGGGPPRGPSPDDEEERRRAERERQRLRDQDAADRDLDEALRQVRQREKAERVALVEERIQQYRRRRERLAAEREGRPVAATPEDAARAEDLEHERRRLAYSRGEIEFDEYAAPRREVLERRATSRLDTGAYTYGPTRAKQAVAEMRALDAEESRMRRESLRDEEATVQAQHALREIDVEGVTEYYERRLAAARRGTAEYARIQQQLLKIDRQTHDQEMADAMRVWRAEVLPARERMRLGATGRAVGTAMGGVGQTLTYGMSAPIAGLIGYASQQAIQAQAQFGTAERMLSHQMTQPELDALRSDLMRRAATQPVEGGFKELTDIAAVGGQLGVGKQGIRDFTQVVVELSSAFTNMNPDETATKMAKLRNTMQLPENSFREIGNVLADLHRSKDLSVTSSEILQMGLRISGIGKVAGMTMPQVLGLAASLGSVGVRAEQGGTAMGRLITLMAIASAKSQTEAERASAQGQVLGMSPAEMKPGQKMLAQFAQVSRVTPAQFQERFREAPAQAIAGFIQGLRTARDSGAPVLQMLDAMGIKQQRLVQSLLQLSNAGNLVTRAMDEAQQAANRGTGLSSTYAQKVALVQSQVQILKNFAQTTGITLGTDFLPIISRDVVPLLTHLVEIVDHAVQAFHRLTPTQKEVVLIMASTAAAIGPVVTGLGRLVLVAAEYQRAVGTLQLLRSGFSPWELTMGQGEFVTSREGVSRRLGMEAIRRTEAGAAAAGEGSEVPGIVEEAASVGGAAAQINAAKTAARGAATELEGAARSSRGFFSAFRTGARGALGVDQVAEAGGLLKLLGGRFTSAGAAATGLFSTIARGVPEAVEAFGGMAGAATPVTAAIAALAYEFMFHGPELWGVKIATVRDDIDAAREATERWKSAVDDLSKAEQHAGQVGQWMAQRDVAETRQTQIDQLKQEIAQEQQPGADQGIVFNPRLAAMQRKLGQLETERDAAKQASDAAWQAHLDTTHENTRRKQQHALDETNVDRATSQPGRAIMQAVLSGAADAIKTPAGEASCADFASALIHQVGIAIPGSSNAKELEQNIKKAGGVEVPTEQAKPGDVVFYHSGHGRSYGKMSGEHVAVYTGSDRIIQSSRGVVSRQPFYDKQNAHVYRIPDEYATGQTIRGPYDMRLFQEKQKGKRDQEKIAAATRAEQAVDDAQSDYDDALRDFTETGSQHFLDVARAAIGRVKSLRIAAARAKKESAAVDSAPSAAAEYLREVDKINGDADDQMHDVVRKIRRFRTDAQFAHRIGVLQRKGAELEGRSSRLQQELGETPSFPEQESLISRSRVNQADVLANARAQARVEFQKTVFDDPTQKAQAIETRRLAVQRAELTYRRQIHELDLQELAIRQKIAEVDLQRLQGSADLAQARVGLARTPEEQATAEEQVRAARRAVLDQQLKIDHMSRDAQVRAGARDKFTKGTEELGIEASGSWERRREERTRAAIEILREQATLTDDVTEKLRLQDSAREQELALAEKTTSVEQRRLLVLQQQAQAIQDQRDATTALSQRSFAASMIQRNATGVQGALSQLYGLATTGNAAQRSAGIGAYATAAEDALKADLLDARETIRLALQLQTAILGSGVATKEDYDRVRQMGAAGLDKMLEDRFRQIESSSKRSRPREERDLLKQVQTDPQLAQLGLTQQATDKIKDRFHDTGKSVMRDLTDSIGQGAQQAGERLIAGLLDPRGRKDAFKAFFDDMVQVGTQALAKLAVSQIVDVFGGMFSGQSRTGAGTTSPVAAAQIGTQALQATGVLPTLFPIGMVAPAPATAAAAGTASAATATAATVATNAAVGVGSAAAAKGAGTAASGALAAAMPWMAAAAILSNPQAVRAITDGLSKITETTGKAVSSIISSVGQAHAAILRGVGDVARGIGGGIGSAAQGIGTGAGNFVAGVGRGIGSIVGGFTGANAMRVSTMNVQSMNHVTIVQGGGGILGAAAGVLGGGGILGGILGTVGKLFGGLFAQGGDIPANKVSIVGERGPEAVVPRGMSTVISYPRTAALAPALYASGAISSQTARLLGVPVGVGAARPITMSGDPHVDHGLRTEIRNLVRALSSGSLAGDNITATATFTGPINAEIDLRKAGSSFARTISRTARTRGR